MITAEFLGSCATRALRRARYSELLIIGFADFCFLDFCFPDFCFQDFFFPGFCFQDFFFPGFFYQEHWAKSDDQRLLATISLLPH
jgi:hypothetical protein